MSEPRRGRPPHAFTIRRVRLVNFHNFVDETVVIREGGHLFLLGDNGCGKTTVLDAIHVALTGALDVELNAAARLAGGREAGRSLQGIVLRYDAEYGVRNTSGAIAYSVLELIDGNDGAVLCLGVGLSATTMDAEVTRWAVLRRGPLEELPLVEERGPDRVPVTREALRLALGKTDVFAKMTEYRRALAERVFGGPAFYEEVCRFWAMAKAYREIVGRSRDFAGLFIRLLPAPDADVFADILGSLRALDELVLLIEQLARQRAYVAGIQDLVSDIGGAREELARYAFLLELRRHAEIGARKASAERAFAGAEQEVLDAAAGVNAARGAVEVAREALRGASGADGAEVLNRLRQLEADFARARGDADVEARAAAAAESRSIDRQKEVDRAWTTLQRLIAGAGAELRAAATAARTVTHPLAATLRVAEQELEAAAKLGPFDPAAASEVERLLAECLSDVSRQHAECARRAAALELSHAELAALESASELPPPVTGLSAARAALATASIDARPLYELLEPAADASDGDLAVLEALLGDAALASLVVPPERRDAARAIAVAHEGVRVVLRSAPDAPPPAWVADLLSASPAALDIVGTLLSQASSLGRLGGPDALGDTEHRGVALRAGNGVPRWIGVEARKHAREARIKAAQQGVAKAERFLLDAEAARERAERTRDAALHVRRALDGVRGAEILDAGARLDTARLLAAEADERTREAAARRHTAELRSREIEEVVRALRARAQQDDLVELTRRLEELRAREVLAVESEAKARNREAEARVRKANLERDIEAAASDERAVVSRLGACRSVLRQALGVLSRPEAHYEDAELERWVRITMRGDQFTSSDNIEERRREADRREASACTEIEGDGSRGIRNLEWAGRFGFAWSSPDLSVVDRRGDALAGVLARIDRDVAEQREVVNERTRELMDRLVMGDLSRELQGQVERLYRTVRDINRLLGDLRFGSTCYQFKIAPHANAQELVELVRKQSALDEASRVRFRSFIDERLDDLRAPEREGDVPELLDYRRWFDYRLSMRSTGRSDTELTRELRALGSGGEQGVPNYLLVLALAKLMFDNAGARVRPVLFDEAFYGIDSGRRDQLLRFATELGVQLVVASPDQDGASPSATRATTLFVLRDENGDVHLAPYHYWNDGSVPQKSLFPERPEEPAPENAICVVGSEGSA